MGEVIWTDDEGCICNIPVEYKYADDNKLWNVSHATLKNSGASVVYFIETGSANTAEGEYCVHCTGTSSTTVLFYELPANGSSYASIAETDKTKLNVYNVNRQNSLSNNYTDIYLGHNARWVHAVDSTELAQSVFNVYYPFHSTHNSTPWILNSSATYAIVVLSGANDNYLSMTYTWKEATV